MLNTFEHIRHIPHFHLIRMVESRLLSQYLKSASVPFLDLGCGDGEFGRSLGLQKVYGIDIDFNALNRLNRDGYYTEVHNANASAIPYPDDFFGAVFSNCAVEHMDNLREVLGEVRRVIKKGGEFTFTVPTPKFFDLVIKDKILIGAGLVDDAVIAEYNRIHHHLNIYSLDEWSNLLDIAGFKVDCHNSYLPGLVGRFVARLDMLYTIGRDEYEQLIKKLEEKYLSNSNLIHRIIIRYYMHNPLMINSGTHIIIKAIRK